MTRFLSLLCAVAIATVFALPASAQRFGDGSAFAPAKFGENNAQLKAVLALQYQMQILRRMIEREKSVNAMIVSAVAIGVSEPRIPKPDQALCLQVPANIPCAQAYKDIYPDYSVAKTEAPVPMPSAEMTATMPAIGADQLPALPQAAAADTLYWTDVTCLQQKCTAIITPDPKNPRARYRVTTGDVLADGAIVSGISANGVTLSDKKKSVTLDPAPKA